MVSLADGSWTASSFATPFVDAARMSCPTTSFCLVSDGRTSVTSVDAVDWTAPIAVGDEFLSALDCLSSTYCLAVNGAGNEVDFNGSGWSAPTSAGVYVDSVSCPSEAFCVAVGSSIVFTRMGGTWSEQASVDPSRGPALRISCTSSTFCLEIDRSEAAFVQHDGVWQAAGVAPLTAVTSVSCASNSFCVAVDRYGQAAVFDGTSWSAAVPAPLYHQWNDVSCPAVGFCVAVGNYGIRYVASVFDGTTWSDDAALPQSNANVDSVSCTSSSFCMATGEGGAVYQFDGDTWTSSILPGPAAPAEYYPVSCVSSKFCMAVGSTGGFGFTGSAWSPLVSGRAYCELLSCASVSSCVVGFDVGTQSAPDGHAWSAAQTSTARWGRPASRVRPSTTAPPSICTPRYWSPLRGPADRSPPTIRLPR